MDEIWKEIEGYEGLYQISNFGNVKSFKRYKDGKLMTPKEDKDGYLSVGIRDVNGKRRHYRIHRLVGIAFIPNPEGHEFINHKDVNPANNEVSNLEWCNIEYNNKYRFNMGYEHKGEKATTAILTEGQALEIYELAWNSAMMQKEIAKMFGVTRSAVSNIKYGQSWSHITGHENYWDKRSG